MSGVGATAPESAAGEGQGPAPHHSPGLGSEPTPPECPVGPKGHHCPQAGVWFMPWPSVTGKDTLPAWHPGPPLRIHTPGLGGQVTPTRAHDPREEDTRWQEAQASQGPTAGATQCGWPPGLRGWHVPTLEACSLSGKHCARQPPSTCGHSRCVGSVVESSWAGTFLSGQPPPGLTATPSGGPGPATPASYSCRRRSPCSR